MSILQAINMCITVVRYVNLCTHMYYIANFWGYLSNVFMGSEVVGCRGREETIILGICIYFLFNIYNFYPLIIIVSYIYICMYSYKASGQK